MSYSPEQKQSAFYDLDQLKQIPILQVCRDFLGLECVVRGGRHWCKAHPERTPSALLNEDRNTFYDFGTQEHGDVIGLVAYVMNIERKDAIKVLAEAYSIAPIDRRKDLAPHELSAWDYAKIGLYADMATKNFIFDVERMPFDKICEISQKYSIPMNELRKRYPSMYERVLRQKALPHVRTIRNEYFLELWSQYQLTCHIGDPALFFRPDSLHLFDERIKALQDAEQVLKRAIEGTGIELRPPRTYDPAKDLELLSEGKIKPVLGPAGYQELQDAAKLAGCAVKHWTFDYDQYALHMMCEPNNELFYSAFLKAGRVVIGFLESDLDRFKPYFDKMRAGQAKAAKTNNKTPVQSKPGAIPRPQGAPER